MERGERARQALVAWLTSEDGPGDGPTPWTLAQVAAFEASAGAACILTLAAVLQADGGWLR
ncbi:MAG: hypothetical protein KC549_15310, partial [Myxococcales bacterium]|nr:hypothetical protein [Myxococcales bacterium]